MAHRKTFKPNKCDRCGKTPVYALELRNAKQGKKYRACENCFQELASNNKVRLCAYLPGVIK